MFEDDLKSLYEEKERLGYTWGDIARILNEKHHTNYSGDAYRKRFSRLRKKDDYEQFSFDYDSPTPVVGEPELNVSEELTKRIEIQRLKDERNQLNQIYRQASREMLLKDIGIECAKIIAEKNPFTKVFEKRTFYTSNHCGILLLSDWHYGSVVNNYWNKYDPDICQKRLSYILTDTASLVERYGISKLYVLNLGDLISGRIHAQTRIENREDVISQVMHVSEILAEFLYNLSITVPIEYYDCLDNHSRVEPNIKESLRLESLARIITWYLFERFKDDDLVNINFNEYSDDIVAFTTKDGWNVVGVHGDLDAQKAVIKNMRGMLWERPHLVCTAHLHHFSADEENECMMISNPSLMGTDGFAESKRLTSKPAQTLIVTSEKSPTYAIHRLVVD